MQPLRFTNRVLLASLLLPLMAVGLWNDVGSGHTWLRIAWQTLVVFDTTLVACAVAYALRAQVVASDAGLVVRSLRTKVVPWRDIEAIDVRHDRITGRRAVLRTAGGTIPLPAPAPAFAGGRLDRAVADLRAELSRRGGGTAVD